MIFRIVAETHYQLGVNLLMSRIGHLQKAEDEETKKEVADLKALIPEIEEKIKDTEVSLGYGLYLLITFIPGPKEGI